MSTTSAEAGRKPGEQHPFDAVAALPPPRRDPPEQSSDQPTNTRDDPSLLLEECHGPRTPPVPDQAVRPGAGFWIRALGQIIDMVFGFLLGLIGGVLFGIVLAIMDIAGTLAPGWEQRAQEASAITYALSLLGACLYHTMCEGIHGASLGKLMCGLRVLRQDGRPSTMKGALLRSLAWHVDALFFGLVGYAFMSKSPSNQRLGDRWGKTIVSRTKDLPPMHPRSARDFIAGFLLGSASWISLLILGTLLQVL